MNSNPYYITSNKTLIMKRKIMDFKKWNKEKLLLRLATFPIKLLFQLTWGVLSSVLISIKWVKNGGQDLVYGDDFKSSIVRLIEQNEIMIDKMNKKKKTMNTDNTIEEDFLKDKGIEKDGFGEVNLTELLAEYSLFRNKQLLESQTILKHKIKGIEKLISKYKEDWDENGMGYGISYSKLISELENVINPKTETPLT